MIRITRKLLKILNSKQKWMTVLIAVMMLFGGVLESVSISLILPLITAVMDTEGWNRKWYARIICNSFSITSQRNYIEYVLVILVVIFIVKNLYLLFEYYVQNSFIAKSRFNMQRKLMQSYTHKPYSYFVTASSGEVLRIITQDTNQAFSILTNILRIYTELIVSIILGITVLIMSPSIAVCMIIILGIELVVIYYLIKPVMEREGEKGRSENAATNKWILQTIQGIKSVKVSRKEFFFEKEYEKHAFQQVEIERKNQTLENFPRLIIESLTVSGVLLVILMFVVGGTDLADILPQLSAFVVGAIRILPSSNRISSSLNLATFLEGGLDNVIRAMGTEVSDEKNKLKNEGAQRIITFQKDIRLDNITFSYENGSSNILKNTYMKIAKGQSVGIIGPSGAGKSTCIDIILGLLLPQRGRVLVDGVNIHDGINSWLDQVAYIPQQIFLLDDTIRANVAFGIDCEQIDDSVVWEALREAQLDEFVRTLPEGLETGIGEQGIRLSGGQRQRIGIARALYNNAEALFFDEATSALDNDTESAIMESIEGLKGKRTIIIIAHRLTTIADCDIIYRVENGDISIVNKEDLGV